MANQNVTLTSPLQGVQAAGGFDFSSMPLQALVARVQGNVYCLTYNGSYSGAAPSLSANVVRAATLQFSTKGQALLLSTTTVDLNTAAATTLYTVPAGKTFILRRVVMRGASVSLTTASVSF